MQTKHSASRRLVVLGQAPSSDTDGLEPLSGRTGARLAGFLGLNDPAQLRGVARLQNVLERFPGKAGKGDAFPSRPARSAAVAILPQLEGASVVVLGLGVARALGLRARLLQSERAHGATFLVFPHPSGVSTWWNCPERAALAVESLRAFVYGSTQPVQRSLTATQPTKLHHRQKQSTWRKPA